MARRSPEPLSSSFKPKLPTDLRLTLRPLRRGGSDPCLRVRADGIWRASRNPMGAATTRIWVEGDQVRIEAWGEGAEWALEHAPALCGYLDDPSGFEPRHGLVRELSRRFAGLRLPRTGAVVEALVPSILEQKVPGVQAWLSYRSLVAETGEPAPGPVPLRLQPRPAALAAMPYWAFHRFGIERRRADVLRVAASRAARLEEAAAMDPEPARRRLRALPGVGAWTAAEVTALALGDPDAVSIGDYHLPHVVSWALAGEPRGTNERMLELLEPYRGHRGRVIRLLEAAGIGAPRRGPRLPLRWITQT
jgi:3-methyladenine DNA glycosylase/8-oxoguanine DNA glycosylase